jgi:hypothetical protein
VGGYLSDSTTSLVIASFAVWPILGHRGAQNCISGFTALAEISNRQTPKAPKQQAWRKIKPQPDREVASPEKPASTWKAKPENP